MNGIIHNTIISKNLKKYVNIWRCCLQYQTFYYQKLYEGTYSGTSGGAGNFNAGSDCLGKLQINRPSDNASLDLSTSDGTSTTYTHLVGNGTYSGQSVYKQNLSFKKIVFWCFKLPLKKFHWN